MNQQTSSRMFFLDWIRIGAFFLLILYHTGMYYVSWDFHIKSVDAGSAIEPLMMLSSPWRLSLLFPVSGVASSFMLRKMPLARFIGQRSWRLLIPLVFGMLVIVPPQSYCEVVEKLGYQGSFVDFMKLYLTGYHGFCGKDGNCLILPTWNHLWFVSYLWVYTLVLAAGVALLGHRFDALAGRLGALLTGWKIIVLPVALFAVLRLTLFARFPSTHALVGDWYNHANYFAIFAMGALMAREPGFWARLDTLRRPALAITIASWAALIVYFRLADTIMTDDVVAVARPIMRVVYALCAWCAIVAVCGFGHRHLQFDNAQRRYLTQAVFPVYMVHQTLIILLAHSFKPLHIAAPLEGGLIVVLTFALSFAVVEIVRRTHVLALLFGAANTLLPQSAARSANSITSAPMASAKS